ncbi:MULTISPECIES: flagellar export chaperone FliS [unclassified Gilliamella]|uniref:flagellar export chaperone FliS n=1 Tax=unclassified Gilliamella TaxID=2685620 RepID=UPI001C6A6C09|nr:MULTISPECIES: flagellar export chaperone FliS [unclassified Gilliamella]MCX8601749.1 flagellar export chaperone FliS [Gilliamella sp. B3722]MCX8608407.1 flagellar export chaperone FliS [Gilliamella sp. B3771]MCX8611012.1 flagellar export chaperone FliS [Gilliamella sp. B3891]MCX8613480.1 flagellar export chaperone FliS [Gilliamella sp. B3773]MCX8616394.1 flagellar export chaperone FliS [Gilliamella sp. B3770]
MYKVGSQAYQQVNLETCVSQASPHQLIVLLFDGALNAIKLANLYIQKGDIAGKGKAISKAINIVDNGLKSALDLEQGGEIAENLDRLYHYISQQLVLANLHNSQDKLQTCYDLLNNIADAWREIAK